MMKTRLMVLTVLLFTLAFMASHVRADGPFPTYLPLMQTRRPELKLAFSRHCDAGTGDIYVMNADGNNPINLTQNLGGYGPPTWSPDGAKVAVVANRMGNNDIYVMNADGSHQTNLTTRYGGDGPSWSPDGRKIAFNRDGSVYVIDFWRNKETQ